MEIEEITRKAEDLSDGSGLNPKCSLRRIAVVESRLTYHPETKEIGETAPKPPTETTPPVPLMERLSGACPANANRLVEAREGGKYTRPLG